MNQDAVIRTSAEHPAHAFRPDPTRAGLIAKIRYLESFNWSVSHGLRHQLEAIARRAQQASAAARTADISQAPRLLDSIDEQSNEASELLASLLALSLAGTEAVEKAPVSLDALVRECWSQVRDRVNRPNLPALNVQGPLPTVHADPRLLRPVLLDLLQNAVKFTQPVREPKIEIGCIHDDRQIFFIRDNGIGLDSEVAAQLFKPFAQPHPEQFDGSGLGLAIAQRIVQGHGGDIWVESSPSSGTCFFFALEGGAER